MKVHDTKGEYENIKDNMNNYIGHECDATCSNHNIRFLENLEYLNA